MKFMITAFVALVSFNVLAKDAEKVRKPSNDLAGHCTASIRENGEFGTPGRRAVCAVNQIVEENSLASYLEALSVQAKSGYTKPFGDLKVVELKSDTTGSKPQYSFSCR